jgi:hypothetical protein
MSEAVSVLSENERETLEAVVKNIATLAAHLATSPVPSAEGFPRISLQAVRCLGED